MEIMNNIYNDAICVLLLHCNKLYYLSNAPIACIFFYCSFFFRFLSKTVFFWLQEAKKLGYSDKQIASLLKSSETVVRARRKRLGVPGPWVKQVTITKQILIFKYDNKNQGLLLLCRIVCLCILICVRQNMLKLVHLGFE